MKGSENENSCDNPGKDGLYQIAWKSVDGNL